jgi:hypothetical protein
MHVFKEHALNTAYFILPRRMLHTLLLFDNSTLQPPIHAEPW